MLSSRHQFAMLGTAEKEDAKQNDAHICEKLHTNPNPNMQEGKEEFNFK